MIQPPIAILKSLWSRQPNGRWGTTDIKSLDLKPKAGFDGNYFAIDSQVELMTTTPSKNIHEVFASFGSTQFLMKQSIVPVVAWKDGDDSVKCIGTASVISCSGYLLTAAHVLIDPFESGYGGARHGVELSPDKTLNFGVFMPLSSAYGINGFRFFPFEKYWIWGSWKESPLFNEKDRFEYLTDIAVCKIAGMPYGAAHQPLNLSVNPFVPREATYSLGYAEMSDIPLVAHDGSVAFSNFKMELYVSIGEVMQVFPQNSSEKKDASTPGPCFDFDAKIPGKMSGAPIFGAQGAVIRGVVSRSFSGERHAFGAMLGPAMHLPLDDGRTLQTLMDSGNEGMARIRGVGL